MRSTCGPTPRSQASATCEGVASWRRATRATVGSARGAPGRPERRPEREEGHERQPALAGTLEHVAPRALEHVELVLHAGEGGERERPVDLLERGGAQSDELELALVPQVDEGAERLLEGHAGVRPSSSPPRPAGGSRGRGARGRAVSGRRRTPGLRREELAQLAGVGVSWCTWLEQGRDIHPSPQILDALARALGLAQAERAHLFHLARVELPLPGPEYPREAPPALRALVEGLAPHPAYLTDPRADVLAWNVAAARVIADFGAMGLERRNALWWLFATRELQGPQWEDTAKRTLARLRAEHARRPGDPGFARLVAELQAASPEFAAWWAAPRGARGAVAHEDDPPPGAGAARPAPPPVRAHEPPRAAAHRLRPGGRGHTHGPRGVTTAASAPAEGADPH